MTSFTLHWNSLELPSVNSTVTSRHVVASATRNAQMLSINRKPGLLVTEPDVCPTARTMTGDTGRRPAVKPAQMRILVTL